MTYSAASRKDVRAAEKAQRLSILVRGEVITGLMSLPNGRQWMFERLEEAQVFADPFSPDPSINAYNAGLRAQGIKLFNDITTFCPQQFHVMIGEYHARSAAADERTRGPNDNGRDSGSGDTTFGTEFEYDPNDRDEARAEA